MRASDQAKAPVELGDGKSLPGLGEDLGDDEVKGEGEADGVAEEVQGNVKESIGRKRRAEKDRDIDWNAHPNYDRRSRGRRSDREKANGDVGPGGTEEEAEHAGVKAWIKNVWSAWS
ncbi:hypothetical protein IFR05_017339 [Cadophora sp. M221]|nr:hypothetical protein IFR05_017339 [Cadophora sp. M221]